MTPEVDLWAIYSARDVLFTELRDRLAEAKDVGDQTRADGLSALINDIALEFGKPLSDELIARGWLPAEAADA